MIHTLLSLLLVLLLVFIGICLLLFIALVLATAWQMQQEGIVLLDSRGRRRVPDGELIARLSCTILSSTLLTLLVLPLLVVFSRLVAKKEEGDA